MAVATMDRIRDKTGSRRTRGPHSAGPARKPHLTGPVTALGSPRTAVGNSAPLGTQNWIIGAPWIAPSKKLSAAPSRRPVSLNARD